jgi:hypothetical protein
MRELKVRRLVRRYEQPRPDRRLKSDAAEHAFGILRSTYADFGPTLATEKLRTKHGIDLAKKTVHRLTTVRDSNELGASARRTSSLGASSRISISLKSAPLGVLPLFDDLRFVPEEIAWPGSARLCRVCGIVKRARLQRQTAAADARCKPLAQSDQRIDPTIQNRPPRTR